MKKLIALIFTALFILSNYSVVSEINNNDEDIQIIIDTISFSNIIIEEKNEYLSIELNESTSKLVEPGKPILPIITKFFTFPLGTKIHEITVTYDTRDIILNKTIQVSPTPFYNSRIEQKNEL